MEIIAVIPETVTTPGYSFFLTATGVGVEISDDGFKRIELHRHMYALLDYLMPDLGKALC